IDGMVVKVVNQLLNRDLIEIQFRDDFRFAAGFSHEFATQAPSVLNAANQKEARLLRLAEPALIGPVNEFFFQVNEDKSEASKQDDNRSRYCGLIVGQEDKENGGQRHQDARFEERPESLAPGKEKWPLIEALPFEEHGHEWHHGEKPHVVVKRKN